MRRVVPAAAWVVVGTVMATVGLDAYLKLGRDSGAAVLALRWDAFPVRYMVTNRDVSGVSAPDLQSAVARAFATWGQVPETTIQGEFIGFSSREPFVEDDVSTIGFRSRPDLDRTLGATTFSVDEVTGRILESDIFLNSTFDWSTSGEPGRYDVESVVVHELGHLLGLGHSALGETELLSGGRRRVLAKRAVMFPIAYPAGATIDRQLAPDDVAGLYDTYAAEPGTTHGAINGRVVRDGKGVFGAHVTALNLRSAELVSSFTLDDEGRFVMAGLLPGLYVVRAEPLDDADIDSFFEAEANVDLSFVPAYAARLATVPAGGTSNEIVVQVKAK